MSKLNYDVIGFQICTNETLILSGHEGWHQVSIKVTPDSTTNLTVQGNTSVTIGGKLATTNIVRANEVLNLGSGHSAVDGIILTAPSGCTAELTCYRLTNNS